MIDVNEIDLDSLTTLELWELHCRIEMRLPPAYDHHGDEICPWPHTGFDSYAARARMKAHA